MESRPQITIPPAPADKLMERASIVLLLLLWAIVLFALARLPDTIPSHFNASGKVDGYSGKGTILLLPFAATVIYLLMTVLGQKPHLFNFPLSVTAENAPQLYAHATRLIRVLKMLVVLVFIGVAFMIFNAVFGWNSTIGRWFLPVAIALLILPTVFYLVKSAQSIRKG